MEQQGAEHAGDGRNNNKVFAFDGDASANNTDIENGPNFVDP